MSDVAAAIRAKLDSMVEGSGNVRSCAGCEGDCYCQAWIDYQNALAAVLDACAPDALPPNGCGCDGDLKLWILHQVAKALEVDDA